MYNYGENMKDKEFIPCKECGGEGATYEVDPKNDKYFLQYICQECGGTGGKWKDEKQQ